MSWFSGFLVARVDDRKTAWGERNGKKSKRKGGSSLCNPRYMSCLRDPDAMEPPSGAPLHQHHRGGVAGAVGGGSNFGVRCGWQEDHYGKRGGASGEGVGLKSVDLGFEDGELKGRKGGCNGGSGDMGDEGPNGTAGVVTAADCWLRVVRVFQSKKFQSRKLERLYQRYFFRLNQSSLTMLMGVLVIVCGIMLTFHCVHAAPHVAYSSALSVAMALFMALMVVCNRNGFHQDYMWMVSYLVIGVLVSVQLFGVLMVAPRSASEGIWWSVFFIYIIYTLLPVRMRAAVLSGAVLSVMHVVTTWQINQEDKFLWKQVRLNMLLTVLFVCHGWPDTDTDSEQSGNYFGSLTFIFPWCHVISVYGQCILQLFWFIKFNSKVQYTLIMLYIDVIYTLQAKACCVAKHCLNSHNYKDLEWWSLKYSFVSS